MNLKRAFIPTLPAGRYERLFYDTANVRILENGVTCITDFSRFGLPNGLPIIDGATQGTVRGGFPLVRFRNVFPAEFKQDQFTTRLNYNLSKGDASGNNINTINGTFFFANFPAVDLFSDDTLVSPTPLIRDDRNRTLAIADTHYFNGNLTNEARFGYFSLNNSRQLDERFLARELTNSGLGIINPATAFEPGAPSQRAARFAGTANLSDFSLNAPNDVYNRRKQLTLTFADNITYNRGSHTLRFGIEHKRNFFDTNLPEEQGIEFEGVTNFTELFTGFVPEADVSLGITDKQFCFNDLSFYASDDYRFSENLTLNLGLRWDWFGLPTEKNGRFANFDFSRVTDPNDIRPGFILPSNAKATGFNAIDGSLSSIASAGNKHTLNGQDLNISNSNFDLPNALITGDVSVSYLGLDPTDAVILQSRGYSFYHSGQFSLTKRFTKGFGFTTSYTFSKSIDIGSTDPGSTVPANTYFLSVNSDAGNFGFANQAVNIGGQVVGANGTITLFNSSFGDCPNRVYGAGGFFNESCLLSNRRVCKQATDTEIFSNFAIKSR